MAEWQQRVVEEKQELDERLGRLNVFREAAFDQLTSDELGRLNRQHSLMLQYSQVLGERIGAF